MFFTKFLMTTQSFLGIDFWNGSTKELLESADRSGGLFTVPSAPSLAQMRQDPALMRAYQASDWAVVDGGYVALVLRLFFGKDVPRISGLQILQRLLEDNGRRAIPFHQRKVLWVIPNQEEGDRIERYLKTQGFSSELQQWYLAPYYRCEADFEDGTLAAAAVSFQPDWIILCISGGKQEKLGYFIRSLSARFTATNSEGETRPKGPVLLCTGGAISFLSGGQINIPTWADRMYLGWFLRICQSPKQFLPRYWVAGYEFPRLLWEKRDSLFVAKKV